MFPWILCVVLTLPNGVKSPTVIAGFREQAACELVRERLRFESRDGSAAPTFCKRAYRT